MSGFGRVPMFGGAAQQRQVRLSGASRTDVDSVEELRSKRQQRESRQAERQREAATLALQAAWRGARVRAQLRRDARVRFDALVANGGASGAPVDVATRELLRFLDASQRGDLARFVRVLHLIDAEASALGLLPTHAVRRLARFAALRLDDNALPLELHARCVTFLTNVVAQRGAAWLDVDALRRTAHRWLVAHAATSELEKQTASQFLRLSIAVAPERFDVLYLLAIPLLVSRLRLYGADTRAAVIAHLVRALAAAPLVTRADANCEWLASATGALWAFGNALALGDDVDITQQTPSVANYIASLSTISVLMADLEVSKEERDSDDSDDDEEDDDDSDDDGDDGNAANGSSGAAPKSDFPSDVPVALHAFLRKQLARCGAMTKRLFSLTTAPPDSAIHLCSLCVFMRQRFPSVWLLDERAGDDGASDWLDSLFTYNLAALASLARIVLSDATLQQLATAPVSAQTACAGRGEIAKSSAAEVNRCLLVLGALARSMHRTTSVMDDAELLEESRLLPISELVRLCSLLANVLCRLYWLDIRCAARSALSQLLGGLVDRDARRRFCAPDTWLVGACDVAPLVELTRGSLGLDDAGAGVDDFHQGDARRALERSDDLDVDDSEFGGDSFSANCVRAIRLVLRYAPFCVSFEQRVRLMHARLQWEKRHSAARERSELLGAVQLRVHRDSVYSDAYEQLQRLTVSQWREKHRVQFVAGSGDVEAGIDGGGLYKEFLLVCVRQAFGSQFALFVETSGARRLYPNPDADLVADDWQAQLEFLGLIVGKALYESILIELPLASFFLGRLLGRVIQFDDLRSLDDELYRNLLWMKRANAAEIEALELDFTATRTAFGREQSVPLCAGGDKIAVTKANCTRYVRLMAHHLLATQIRAQTAAFERGLSRLINVRLLRMFARHELQLLISGADGTIDVDDMQEHTVLRGYGPRHDVIVWFFDVVREMTASQHANLLLFATGCSRPPLLGFRQLYPSFAIQRSTNDAGDEQDDSHLPTAATCFNMLRLPPYSSREILREKLLAAIESGAGFGLS